MIVLPPAGAEPAATSLSIPLKEGAGRSGNGRAFTWWRHPLGRPSEREVRAWMSYCLMQMEVKHDQTFTPGQAGGCRNPVPLALGFRTELRLDPIPPPHPGRELQYEMLAFCSRSSPPIRGPSGWRRKIGRSSPTFTSAAFRKVPNPAHFFVEIGYVTDVYCIPERRNQGVGDLLMQAAQNWAKAEGLEICSSSGRASSACRFTCATALARKMLSWDILWKETNSGSGEVLGVIFQLADIDIGLVQEVQGVFIDPVSYMVDQAGNTGID